ncbi:MAG TPA: LuxR C-terminal-related transcriptional regulator [Nocardioidaceae bacterium]|nr:LuxR C-terminal-related transcriptional regulator [Nocardioidaceae bacterium]
MTSESTLLRRPSGALPIEVDTFVGRRQELADVRRQFGTSPLVTLTGPGGVGKTRLCLRAAAAMSRTFRDGVCFVELGNLNDAALLVPFVGEALGLRDQALALDLDRVSSSLRDRHLLLVLDNCEHLVGAVASLVDLLLRTCADLRVLATSREALGIPGESVLRVPPLTVPDSGSTHAQSLPGFEAVNLFAERAVLALPEFLLTSENGEDVAQICRQLDGMPLALELAAARLRTLSLKDLTRRLTQRYQLLTGGSRTAPPRHQTLRLCVDWSYEQCSPAEQELWRRVSVFSRGFELDAVEATCTSDGLSEAGLLDVLTALVDKSIVGRSTASGDGATRFDLLESLREYGVERLEEAGELAAMQGRHASWCQDLVVQASTELVGPEQIRWMGRLDRELPNIRTALGQSLRERDLEAAQLIGGSLHMYWISRGLLSEGRHWLERSLAADDVPPSESLLQALFCLVALAGFQGDVDVAAAAVARSRAVASEVPGASSAAYVASVSGMLALFQGDLPSATRDLAAAALGHRDAGDLNRELEILIGLGLASALMGDHDAARAAHERVLSLTQPRGETWYRAYSLWALGLAHMREGANSVARANLEESLRLRSSMHDQLGSVWCLEGLALVAAHDGSMERAAVLFGVASAQSSVAGTPTATFPDLVTLHEDAQRRTRDKLGSAAFDRAYAKGEGLTIEAATAYALGEVASSKAADPTTPWSVLTRREREVAQLVSNGLTNQAIAETLVISIRTAQGHVENILTKLGFNARTQIAAWVAQLDEDS